MSFFDDAAKPFLKATSDAAKAIADSAKAVSDHPKDVLKTMTKVGAAGGAAGIGAQIGAGIGIAAGGTAIVGTLPVALVAGTIGLLASHAVIEAADQEKESDSSADDPESPRKDANSS